MSAAPVALQKQCKRTTVVGCLRQLLLHDQSRDPDPEQRLSLLEGGGSCQMQTSATLGVAGGCLCTAAIPQLPQ